MPVLVPPQVVRREEPGVAPLVLAPMLLGALPLAVGGVRPQIVHAYARLSRLLDGAAGHGAGQQRGGHGEVVNVARRPVCLL